MKQLLAALGLASLLLGTAAAAAVPSPDYRIHAGDRLDVQVLGEPALSQRVFVGEDGAIDLPLAGHLRIAGATPTAAADLIAGSLRTYLRDPLVTVSLGAVAQLTVTVLGDVHEAGKYTLNAGAHVRDALAAAGGLNVPNGSYPTARVALAGGGVEAVPLEAVLRGGDTSRDVELSDRATIYVPGPTQFEVKILGAVDKPGVIAVNEGDRLSMAIAKAGSSVDSKADLSRVLVTRTEPDGKTASHQIDLYRAIDSGDIRYDPRLRKDDIVYVPLGSRTHGALSSGLFLLRTLIGL